MPIYEYRHTGTTGETCDETFELFQKMSDQPLAKCPACDQPVQKLISRFGGGVDRLAPSKLTELGFRRWY